MKDLLESLLTMSGIIGFGHGIKETNGYPTGTEALIIFVEKKIPREQLPENQWIPDSIRGKITDVIEIGKIYSQDSQSRRAPAKQEQLKHIWTMLNLLNEVITIPGVLLFIKQLAIRREDGSTNPVSKSEVLCFKSILEWLGKQRETTKGSRTSYLRPAVPGVSIGHHKGGAGTFGAVVYDTATRKPMILSNNHVLANTSMNSDVRAGLNDPIVQPAAIDGSCDTIGYLSRYIPLKAYPQLNTVDSAVAVPVRATAVKPEILEIGKVIGISEAVSGMTVKKSGRTTGLTVGKIRAVNATVKVSYGEGRTLLFEKQIVASKMSEPGDSGSLVVDVKNKAVGLLFAGSDQSTIINPISLVLEALKVKF